MDHPDNAKTPNRDYGGLVDRTKLLNDIIRYWFHHLTPLERCAVIFVYDRTCGWGKEWETITIEQLTKGVFMYKSEEMSGVDGGYIETYAAPVTKNRTGLVNLMKKLVDKGVLLRRPKVGSNKGLLQYAINADWEWPSIKLPKKFVMGNQKVYRFDQAKQIVREAKAERKREQRSLQKKRARLRKSKQSDS